MSTEEMLAYMRAAALDDDGPNMNAIYETLVGDVCSELLEAYDATP